MKKRLLLACLTIIAYDATAQCPFTVKLNSEGSHCSGSATLNVSSTDTLTKIIWLNGGTPMNTVTDTIAETVMTVAGGNGSGTAPNQANFPQAVYVDKNGYLYVLDIDQVKRFPPGSSSATNGVTVAGGNGQGAASNQFDTPTGLYVDGNGNLYVADAHNNRVQEWTAGATTGITVAGNGISGPAASELFNPGCVYLDAGGNIYVGDNGNNRVQEFPPGSGAATNGVTVAGGNGAGTAANQFSGIDGIFIDGSGSLYVADFENHRVQKFPPGSTGATNGLTVAGGNGAGPAANQFDFPDGLYVDNKGNLYVADQINDRVQEWRPGATSGITVAGGNGQGAAGSQLFWPKGIYADGSGSVYISDSRNNRVQKWTLSSGINTTYVPAVAGTYTAAVTDSAGCTVATNNIIILPAVISSVSISGSRTNICAGDTVIFSATPTNGGDSPSYQWQINGSDQGTNSNTFTDGSLTDMDTVSCILISSESCTLPIASTNTIAMPVRPAPSVSAGNDTTIAPGQRIQLNPSVTGFISAYQWTPGTGLDNPFQPDPIASPTGTTTYQLDVTADNGCTASGRISVGVYYPVQMPNAFTPNGDGQNDVFRVPLAVPQKIKSFSVYDRWGDRVFMTTNTGNGWDGTFNNRQAPVGTYVWAIEYEDPLTGKVLMARGAVMLIR